MGLDVNESGLDLDRLRALVAEALPGAMRRALEEAVLPVSTERVPKDDGDLAASAKIETGDGFASIRYSGPYARKQHELIGFKHLGGGQAKFLESALMSEKDAALEIVAQDIEKAL